MLDVDDWTGANDIQLDPRNPDVLHRDDVAAQARACSASSPAARAPACWRSTDGGQDLDEVAVRISRARTSAASGSRCRRPIRASSTRSPRRRTARADSSARATAARAGSKMSGYQSGGNYYNRSLRRSGERRPRLRRRRQHPGHRRRRQDASTAWASATSTSTITSSWIDPDDDRSPHRRLRRRRVRDVRPRHALALHREPAGHAVLPRVRRTTRSRSTDVFGGAQDNFSVGGPSRTRNDQRHPQRRLVHHARRRRLRQRRRSGRSRTPSTRESQFGGLSRFNLTTGDVDGHSAHRRPTTAPASAGTGIRRSSSARTRTTRLYFAANRLFSQRRPRRHVEGGQSRPLAPDRSQPAQGDGSRMGRGRGRARTRRRRSSARSSTIAESPMKEGSAVRGTDDGRVSDQRRRRRALAHDRPLPGRAGHDVRVITFVPSQHDANTVYATFNNHQCGRLQAVRA